MRHVRLATRASPLALWQARHVASQLRRAHPGLRVSLVPLTSTGDADRVTPLYASSTVGVFVREIQAAVLDGRADAGVHSGKDLPTGLPAGLVLAAWLRRADPRDALVGGPDLASLPHGALIGTSSLRRQHQLAALRPDLRFVAIRGNVDTRLRKVAEGACAATVLAMAGLHRLGLVQAAHAAPLDARTECVPAPAQGAVAVDCRSGDVGVQRLLAALDHRPTRRAVTVERTVLAALDGGCSLPLGCHVRRLADGIWCGDAALGSARGLRTSHARGGLDGLCLLYTSDAADDM
jgi:hydroxymethylbilane synthase